MILRILIFFLISASIPTVYSDGDPTLEVTKSISKLNDTSKIHPILIQWHEAQDQIEFAKNNNLPIVEAKIKVYIYLENQEMQEKLPPEITVTSFDGKIIGALISSDQLETLDKLDFVQKVTLPIAAQTPPIPQTETQTTKTLNDNEHNYILWILLLGILFSSLVVIIKKYLNYKTKLNTNFS